jgi:DNA-binding CsgD family transcriptional regulator
MNAACDACAVIESLHTGVSEQQLEITKLKEYNDVLQSQLQLLTLQTAQCNNVLMVMHKKLNAICEGLPADRGGCREKILQCICQLNLLMKPNIWHEFRLRFVETHPGFYDRLMTSHPALTECDLRLCALIKLGMATKEIASLLNQPVNTIKVARRRLKGKLHQENRTSSLISILARY